MKAYHFKAALVFLESYQELFWWFDGVNNVKKLVVYGYEQSMQAGGTEPESTPSSQFESPLTEVHLTFSV